MKTAVLLSAGLDSVVLAAAALEGTTSRRSGGPGAAVHPIYVSAGLAWEAQERAVLARLLAHPRFAALAPLALLDFSVRDLYPQTHWALRGEPPAFDTPDEDVYLAGRNIALLSKASVYCAGRGVTRIALGILAGNPFPDATPDFFGAMARAMSLGLAHPLTIDTPFASMHKSDVVRLGVELGVPLELTLSCMKGARGDGVAVHCGRCSKCRERRDAFLEASVDDPTIYSVPPAR